MNLDVIITGGVGVITSAITGFLSYLFTKKKYDAEVDGSVIENLQKSLDFYVKLVDDNKIRLDRVSERNHNLEIRNLALEQTVEDLKKQVSIIMQNTCVNLGCNMRKKEFDLFDSKSKKHETKTSKRTKEE